MDIISDKLLEVKKLKTHFHTRRGIIKAVDGVSFSVKKGETLGIVGESGCGKSMICLSIMNHVPGPAGRIVGGEILLDGENILTKTPKEMRGIRGNKISLILQDPMTSLNPLFTIGDQVATPIRLHQKIKKKDLWRKVIEMMEHVKIPSPESRITDYPHQMSGGMRQRIVGAMALSCHPEVLIADEPTTALDVTIQIQYINLLKEIQKQFNLALIVVTHDFGIVAKLCDKVVVMYAGKIVEQAEIKELFNQPKHPYTKALLKSLPNMNKKTDKLFTIEGQPPDLIDPPKGCRFSPRCYSKMKICDLEYPASKYFQNGHQVSCWLYRN